MNSNKRAEKIISLLKNEYPEAKTALTHKNPFQLLVATILSAQCTDERVNKVTPLLFKKYKTPKDFAESKLSELENDIRSTGFFKNKAKNIKGASISIENIFSGKVPKTIEDLTSLDGVGRKTANVVLGNSFGIPSIVVDTHVKRVTHRIGLTKNQDPVKIEFDLMKIIPKSEWTILSHLIIFHGRRICQARKPLCPKCKIRDLCKMGTDLFFENKK